MAHRSEGPGACGDPALPARHAGAGNRIPNGGRPRGGHRFHAAGRRRPSCADCHGPVRTRGLPHRICGAFQLRSDRAMGDPARRRRHQRDCRAGAPGPANARHASRRRPQDARRIRGRGWPVRSFRSVLWGLLSDSAAADRSFRGAGAHARRSGGNGALVVPMRDPGRKRSNARSSH